MYVHANSVCVLVCVCVCVHAHIYVCVSVVLGIKPHTHMCQESPLPLRNIPSLMYSFCKKYSGPWNKFLQFFYILLTCGDAEILAGQGYMSEGICRL